MPKATYLKLPESKKQRIYAVCKKEFSDKPFHQATVRDIVQALEIPRGSFYQYFEDLTDCYMYVLSQETKELHNLFIDLIQKLPLMEALEEYKHLLLKELVHNENYSLYKYRFLDWNYELSLAWKKYNHQTFVTKEPVSPMISVFKSVVHDLVYRLFAEEWDDNEFITHYDNEIAIIMNGVSMSHIHH
ncbi:TetR/AcrR family transcriptional regulator [Lactococcus garvieae]|uniref:Transcription regulator n=1 Tax=Lactococcus garvieae DCC43 TaxID=1231377 RepID=K2QCJ1_9LACT|nr:TetR/AcrR family transcriptional regulator [Lactococcus garvieae]EKF51172.1 transcription regulator [Lactococcus garvieae DCC43]QPS70396.1 TetR/AcrR family transcriptional regulator [Lactococcus garvieae]